MTNKVCALLPILAITLLGNGGTMRDTTPGAKLIFVLYCRADVTHDACMAMWDDAQHLGLVKKVPHLIKHVHNEALQLPFAGAADGIGELWFPSTATMNAALASPEFNAAFEDAQRFLDLSKTYGIAVDEISIIDRTGRGEHEKKR